MTDVDTYSRYMPKWQFPPPPRDDPRRRIRELSTEPNPPITKQHVVSRVVLKGFAAPGSGGRGWELTPFDIRRHGEMKRRGLRECGKAPSNAAIEEARKGRLHEHPHHLATIKDCIALHLVRSHRYLAVHRDSVAGAARQVRRDVPWERTTMLENEFFQRHGLHAAGLETLRTIVDDVIDNWFELDATGALARTSMESMFSRIRQGLRRQPLEIWHVPAGRELLPPTRRQSRSGIATTTPGLS